MPSNDSGSTRRRHAAVLAVASLTWAAAVIHAVVAPDHLREWGPAGAFFIAAAALQLVWSAVILRRPTRRWLLVGAYGNGALVIVWLISRTAGVPVGPDAGTPEALGALDALATLNEVLAVALIAILVSGRSLPARVSHSSGAALAAASLLAVLTVSPHAHGSSHEAGDKGQSRATPNSTHQRPAQHRALSQDRSHPPGHSADPGHSDGAHPHRTSAHSH